MTRTRRDFLLVSAALAVSAGRAPRAWGAALPREADIVVIGAGAAGIAAARRVQAANRKVVVVEADARLGGRCWTDSTTFDVPFDRGARCRARTLGGAARSENPRRPAQCAPRRNRIFSRSTGTHQPRHRRGLTPG